ncbi:uncharacterized protein BDW70DRAFT_142642 [Aspergillus foveolatus]|uniref:uncharacterized protein n=1 Tax=Aspergillus foveolatus TaxID=210207 RepID=UPI003CCDF1B4
MSTKNEVYCPFCSAPAVENCYGEHLLDPATTPDSPELAKALYTSMSTLMSSSLAGEDPRNADATYPGEITETQFRVETEQDIQYIGTGYSSYQAVSKYSESNTAEAGANIDNSPLPVNISPQRKRSKSDPNMTAVAIEKYIAEITDIQARAWQALKEIEKAKNTLWLPQAQHDLWDEAIALGRQKVRVFESKGMQGTLRIELAREFSSRLEEFNARVQIGLKKGTFKG